MTVARKAAIDIGNYKLKGYVEGLKPENEIEILNVIARAPRERDVVDLEKDILDGLHVEIVSGALSSGRGIFYVGNLAARYANNEELLADSEKSENDQTVVLLLAALAVDAARHHNASGGVIEAAYFLSTGLPLAESRQKGRRRAFREKLRNAQHEVRFLDAPKFGGLSVRIRFEDVIVNTEGKAAMVDLTTHDDGRVRNEELLDKTTLICDIGGLSTDCAIILPGGDVDNLNSEGIREGVSPYLDEIMEKTARMHGYRFPSRAALADVITHPSPEERNHIYVKGNRQSIQPIVDEVLMRLAREEYNLIRKLWNRAPFIRVAYLIGGGAVILKPYLEKLNQAQDRFPLRFVESRESVWMIARAYYKLLEIYLAQQNG